MAGPAEGGPRHQGDHPVVQGAGQAAPNRRKTSVGARHGPQGVRPGHPRARRGASGGWDPLGRSWRHGGPRLEAEEISAGLGTELAEVRGILQVESDQHDLLSSAIVVVYDDLQVAQEEGTSSLAARAAGITAQVGQLEESAFHAGIT